MASYSSGAHSQSMLSIDFGDFAGGTITATSATEIDVRGASGLVYKIIGTGFTTFDANGFPTDGTVTEFEIGRGLGAPAIFSGLSMAASDFTTFVESNDLAGFETSALAGDDQLRGYKGDDVLIGGNGNDVFRLPGGGGDTVQGGAGRDAFYFAGTLTAADTVDGGTGSDRVVLDGDYPALALGAATLSGVEYLVLRGNHDYHLVTNDANVAAGAGLAVQAKTLAASNTLYFDGSAETNGFFHVSGGAGDDTLIGGAGGDVLNGGAGDNTFDLTHGGNDKAVGGAGNDKFEVGAALTNLDKIEGGSGDDTITFDGDYAAATTLNIHQFSHIDHVVLIAGHDYDLRLHFDDGDMLAHTILSVDASALGADDHFTFVTNGQLNFETQATVTGGAGDDTIDVQSAQEYTVDETRGGDDTVVGSSLGQTDIVFGAAFTSGDVVHGGAVTTLSFDGDYGNGLVLSASHLRNIGAIFLETGFDYDLRIHGDLGSDKFGDIDIVGRGSAVAGHLVTIDAAALTQRATFNFTTFDSFHIVGGSGTNDYILSSTAASSVVGGAGIDSISWAGFAAGDTVDGGGGDDLLAITYNGTLSSSMIKNVEALNLDNSSVTLADDLIGAGQQMTIVGGGTTTVDGSAETNGTFTFEAQGNVTFTGGAGEDTFDQVSVSRNMNCAGGGGADTIDFSPFFPSSGTAVYHAASDSTGVNFDTINFFTSRDLLDMPVTVTGVDAAITSGTLTTANFDGDLAAAVDAAHLAIHHAVVFTPDSGDYNDESFLVVDLNGTAGYQAGQDIVIQLNAFATEVTTATFV